MFIPWVIAISILLLIAYTNFHSQLLLHNILIILAVFLVTHLSMLLEATTF